MPQARLQGSDSRALVVSLPQFQPEVASQPDGFSQLPAVSQRPGSQAEHYGNEAYAAPGQIAKPAAAENPRAGGCESGRRHQERGRKQSRQANAQAASGRGWKRKFAPARHQNRQADQPHQEQRRQGGIPTAPDLGHKSRNIEGADDRRQPRRPAIQPQKEGQRTQQRAPQGRQRAAKQSLRHSAGWPRAPDPVNRAEQHRVQRKHVRGRARGCRIRVGQLALFRKRTGHTLHLHWPYEVEVGEQKQEPYANRQGKKENHNHETDHAPDSNGRTGARNHTAHRLNGFRSV